MAFSPTISACLNGCTGITFKDTTGFYNATTNEGGWNNNLTLWKLQADGSPHVVTATLSLTLNGGLPTTFNVLTAIQGSIFPTYTLYEYIPVDTYGNPALQDGYYNATLTIVDDEDNTYVTDVDFVVYCNVACCISKMAANLPADSCEKCDSTQFDDFMTAYGIYQALKATAECQGTQEFYKLLTKLQKLCNSSSSTSGGCGCGCS
jgi:hypothetical protein